MTPMKQGEDRNWLCSVGSGAQHEASGAGLHVEACLRRLVIARNGALWSNAPKKDLF